MPAHTCTMDAPTTKQVKRERLDVPGVSPLERRLNVLRPQADASRPSIGPVQQSSVLSRLQGFLPQMQAANAKLQQDMQERPPEEFDIEAVDEEAQDTYIEMDLACGVLDLLDESAVAAADRALQGMTGQVEVAQESEQDADSSSDCSSSDEEEEQGEGGQNGEGSRAQGAGADSSRGAGGPTHRQAAGVHEDDMQVDGQQGASSVPVGRRKVQAKRAGKIEELT